MAMGTRRHPISWILLTRVISGRRPRNTAVARTNVPLVPVRMTDRVQTNRRDDVATLREQNRRCIFESLESIEPSIRRETHAARSMDKRIAARGRASLCNSFATRSSPKKNMTVSIDPLRALRMTNNAPTANTAPDAEMNEYTQMNRDELSISSLPPISLRRGAHRVAEEPDVIPGSQPTIVPPRSDST